MSAPASTPPRTSVEVRRGMLDALRLDLIGPGPDDARLHGEALPQAPSRWYLTGWLVPQAAPPEERANLDADDDLESALERPSGDDDAPPDKPAAKRQLLPSSIGLSVLLEPGTEALDVTVDWGEYLPEGGEADASQLALAPAEERPDAVEIVEVEAEAPTTPGVVEVEPHSWQRRHNRHHLRVPLLPADGSKREVPITADVTVVVHVRPTSMRTGAGSRPVLAAAVFLVNRKAPTYPRDIGCVFQPVLEVASPGLVARSDCTGFGNLDDPDAAIGDLHYRDSVEWTVGHGVGAEPVPDEGGGTVRRVRTTWLPQAAVERVVPNKDITVELDLEALGRLADGAAARAALSSLVSEYEAWITARRGGLGPLAPERRQVAGFLLDDAARACRRIADGIEVLAADPDALDAFRIANRAVAAAARRREAQRRGPGTDPAAMAPPRWYPFQLAFVMLNLQGMVDPTRDDRETVDLLFFPTGGGKTEAYLGLAAFTLVWRRLHAGTPRGLGLAVLMRYTLRLLTLDQLGRASAVVCALELERERDPARLGSWPFEIGLWVGRAATPNRLGGPGDKDDRCAYHRVMRYQRGTTKDLPVPVEACPWCGEKLGKHSFHFLPNARTPEDLRLRCANRDCEFEGTTRFLPILTVDEPIYRRLPAFMIATVDKFASLPWVAETAGLFGRVGSFDPSRGFTGAPRPGSDGLLAPPDLVIQDELHLISGPLGSVAGLFEAALDHLATRHVGERRVRPKVVASTATVRKARPQIKALFARDDAAVFPPPGPDRDDSFFARTLPADDPGSRLYVGLAAQGRGAKVVFLRALASLLAGAQAGREAAGAAGVADDPADPYMTALCYFNALRELGSARRIFEGEIANFVKGYARRSRSGLVAVAERTVQAEPLELTSRYATADVARAKDRLARPYSHPEHVDAALATNMISVGLDITRLGLMLVAGQPKTASEYIQATSRVGRDPNRPGLVLVLLNLAKPRDRSHLERFPHFHATFYRAVEASSATPFSPRALDRALAAVTVAIARLGHGALLPALKAGDVGEIRSVADAVADAIADRAEEAHPGLDVAAKAAARGVVRARARSLLDDWIALATQETDLGGALGYSHGSGISNSLLREGLEGRLSAQQAQFRAPRSMRDVEPSALLAIRDPYLRAMQGGSP